MISPHTPPGTLIVCVNDDLKAFSIANTRYGKGGLNGLTKGVVYTVGDIYPDTFCKSGFAVILNEIDRGVKHDDDRGFDISRFELAVLPKSITDMLTTVKIDDSIMA